MYCPALYNYSNDNNPFKERNIMSHHRGRFLSLYTIGGEEDYFNTEYSDEEQQSRLRHVDVPCLVQMGLRDEFVPGNTDIMAFINKIASALPKGEGNPVNSGHLFKGEEGGIAYNICAFLQDRLPQLRRNW